MRRAVDLRGELAVGRHALDAGRVQRVEELVRAHPRRAERLLELLWDDDAGVASRAADVFERISRDASPALGRVIAGFKDSLIGLLPEARFTKLRWNLAFAVPRLELSRAEARRVAAALEGYLGDRSSIVKTAALQGLADLTRHDPARLPEVVELLQIKGRSGTPAMRARSRILLKRLTPARGRGRGEPGTSCMADTLGGQGEAI